jgi:UDP-2-acetamido-2,6-beta-L-arabino-hexul-4-ose reductase
LAAEALVETHAKNHGSGAAVFRLPNVFGKWCRPNYNSVVATFCHNLTRGLPIEVHDPSRILQLVYVDDVVQSLIDFIYDPPKQFETREVAPVYTLGLGELRDTLEAFGQNRLTIKTEDVGRGVVRALYATYVSYLEPEQFTYSLTKHADPRGVFVEMLKTPAAGQFSYFTAKPGITRGGHYHHTKTEKFLVISGEACFKFRHILTNRTYEVSTCGDLPTIVETVPGWVHDVTNTGSTDLVVMLWANEVFDPAKPDTIAAKLTVDEA